MLTLRAPRVGAAGAEQSGRCRWQPGLLHALEQAGAVDLRHHLVAQPRLGVRPLTAGARGQVAAVQNTLQHLRRWGRVCRLGRQSAGESGVEGGLGGVQRHEPALLAGRKQAGARARRRPSGRCCPAACLRPGPASPRERVRTSSSASPDWGTSFRLTSALSRSISSSALRLEEPLEAWRVGSGGQAGRR